MQLIKRKKMNQVNSKPAVGTQTLAKKVLDFIIGFLGSIILVNIGIVLIAQILINIGIVLVAQIPGCFFQEWDPISSNWRKISKI